MSLTRDMSSSACRRWHDAAYWGLLAIACLVMLVMNVWTPFKEDDMAFALIAGGSLHDIWQSQVDHFMTANGRFADVVATLFCAFLGKAAFNVINTLVFGLMAHLVTVLATDRRSVMVLAMFLALVGCCFPVPGQTMLFVAGSCNYLWAITASLLLVRYLQSQHEAPLSWWRGALLLLGVFIAGNFNEAASFGFFAGLCLYYVFNRREVNRREIVALAGYLLGILLIVASPGAWERAAQGDIVVNLGFTDLLSSRWHIFGDKMWRFVTPLLAFAAGLVVLFWKGVGVLRRNVWTWVFLSLSLVMFALGVLHERAYAALTTVGFIIVAMAADALLSRYRWTRVAVTLVALSLATFTMARGLKQVRAYKAYEDGVVSAIREAPREAILRESRFNGYSRFVTALRYVSSEYFVREDIYRAYYDKDNVQFVSDSVYVRYQEGRLLDGATELPMSTDHPELFGTAFGFPDQDYMVMEVMVDSLPVTAQLARYNHWADGEKLSAEEKDYRRKYGLVTEYTPHGFYPLRYQGRQFLVFTVMDSTVSDIVFPVDGRCEPPIQCTISRTAPK